MKYSQRMLTPPSRLCKAHPLSRFIRPNPMRSTCLFFNNHRCTYTSKHSFSLALPCLNNTPLNGRSIYSTASSRSLCVEDLQTKKRHGSKISMITAYDAVSARIADDCLVDSILVGDSLANVFLGFDRTSSVDMETMLYHAKAVTSGTRRAMVIGDLPFGTYATAETALENSIRYVREAGVDCVKLEGFLPNIVAAIHPFVPVCGHLGVQPQTAGSFRSRGRTAEDGQRLLHEAEALEKAGCSLLVLEKVTVEVAEAIAKRLTIPTIGIGSGVDCDGQVLVWNDVIGLHDPSFRLKFAKKYSDVYTFTQKAVNSYIRDVKNEVFPQAEHSFYMPAKERCVFASMVEASNVAVTASASAVSVAGTETIPHVPMHYDKIVIRGSGGMACLFANALSLLENTETVVYTKWLQQAEAIKQNGNRLLVYNTVGGADSTELSGPLHVTTEEDALLDDSYKLIVVCVKSNGILEAVEFAKRKVVKDGSGAILLIQNGLDASLGATNVLRNSPNIALLHGVVNINADVKENGSVKITFARDVKLAPVESRHYGASKAIAALLQKSGIPCESFRASQLAAIQWEKLALNCAVNSVSTIFGCYTSELQQPHKREMVLQIIREVCATARKQGIPLEYETLSHDILQMISKNEGGITSTLKDFRAGRPTEIEALCGSVVRVARGVGYEAPVNEFALQLIKALEQQRHEAAGQVRTRGLNSTRTETHLTAIMQHRRSMFELNATVHLILLPSSKLEPHHLAMLQVLAKDRAACMEWWCFNYGDLLDSTKGTFGEEEAMDTPSLVKALSSSVGVRILFQPNVDTLYASPPSDNWVKPLCERLEGLSVFHRDTAVSLFAAQPLNLHITSRDWETVGPALNAYTAYNPYAATMLHNEL